MGQILDVRFPAIAQIKMQQSMRITGGYSAISKRRWWGGSCPVEINPIPEAAPKPFTEADGVS